MSGPLDIAKSKAAGRWWPRIAGGVALLVALAVSFFSPDALSAYGFRLFDAFQRAEPRAAEDIGVRVVDIDDESIRRMGQWPWPRTRLAALNDRLFDAGAGVVAYDIVFAEPDRTSPERVVETLLENGAPDLVASALGGMPAHDTIFGAALAEHPTVLGYALSREPTAPAPRSRVGAVVLGETPSRDLAPFQGALPSIPVIAEGAYDQGFISLEPDGDNIVRRAPLVTEVGGTIVPSLSLSVVRFIREVMGENTGAYVLSTSTGSGQWAGGGRGSVLTGVRIGSLDVPLTEAGEMWVHFRGADQSVPTMPAWKLLDDDTGAAELDAFFGGGSLGAGVVFIGASATLLNDLKATPAAPLVPGVYVHAEAAEQMLSFSPQFLSTPDWAPGLRMLAMAAGGTIIVALVPLLGPLLGGVFGGTMIAALFGTSWLLFSRQGLLFDPVYPAVALAGVYGVTALTRFFATERQRAHISGAFSRYLSPEMVDRIADDPGQLRLGGEERDMTVLFCDIRGFSKIAERMSSAEVTRYLNRFLTPMTDILLGHRATLDKYIGDAIMAFWNAPLDDRDHEANAARAALAMQRALRAMNERLGPLGLPVETHIGIGLEAGPCAVGNMGSDQRFAYSVLGDVVNRASRLEGMTKAYDTPIIVGDHLAARLPGFALLELDRVRAVGKDEAMTIFALLGDKPVADGTGFEALRRPHTDFLARYRNRDFSTALDWLDTLIDGGRPFGLEGYYRVMGARIADFIENPPPENWDGTAVLTQK